jgi:BatD DUF11 like domain
MKHKLLLTLSLLFFSQLLLAAITVKVDREPIVVDESFHLVFESDQKIDADPDFSPLNKSFTVLNSSRRSNTQITNGKVNHSQMWILTVISNKTGSVGIPSIRFGKELTRPLSINIMAGAPSTQAKGTDNIFIEVEVNTKKPYVQAQLIYTVKLYRSVVTNNASLSEPELTGGQAVINKLGEDSSFETQRNGKRYVVIQRQYVIFPQSSGVLKIEPIMFQGQTGGAGGFFNFDPYGQQSTAIVKRSRVIELDVKPIPDSFTGDTWLPANQLTVQEQWSVDPSKLEQGEATTRTLTLIASGLAASHLPAIKSNLPDSLKQYPDQPEFEESNNAEGYVGIRRDKMAIIPTEAGDVILPAVKIPWWNTVTDKMEIAELPERLISVTANTTAVVDSVVEDRVNTSDIALSEPNNTEEGSTITNNSNSEAPVWKWVSLLLSLLWLVTLIVFWRSKRKAPVSNVEAEEKTSSRQQLKKIQQACKNNNATMAKQALLEWANSLWADKKINSINAIKKYCDEEFMSKLDDLNNYLYGNSTSDWDGMTFLKSFEAQSFDKKQSITATGKLEPLYKT